MIPEGELTGMDVLKGTDLGQLLKTAGLYHNPGGTPGQDGVEHDVREPWYEFLKQSMGTSHGEAQRKYVQLSLCAMDIYSVRNPEFHSNDIPLRYHKEGAEAMFKFYELLFNPHDKWIQQ